MRLAHGVSVFYELESREELAARAAEFIVERGREAIASWGRFLLALSGGSSPLPTYERLVSEHAHALDWSRVRLYWGDERCVPADDPQNNARAALDILGALPIPEEQVFRVRTELDAEQAAVKYEHVLRNAFGTRPDSTFDLVLLGMGSDGHTASLFPGSDVLDETERYVLGVHVPGATPPDRITVTYRTLSEARAVAFLVAGADKAPLWERLRDGDESADFPAARVRCQGEVRWYVTGKDS